MSADESENSERAEGFLSAFSALETADKAFYGLVSVAFVVLVILAFLGKSTEMTVLGAFTAIALAFLKLERFTEFSALGFSGKLRDVEEKVKALADKETEIDPKELPEQFGEFSVLQVSPQEKRALEAIYRSNFTFRSVGGISEQLGISNATASRILNTLLQKGFVSHGVSSKRRSIWNITEAGIAYLQSSSEREKQEANTE